MVPENKRAAVEKALQTAFGTTEIEDICEMTAGLSTALIYRIVVTGEPYLLRVITREDAVSDPSHWYASMTAAAEAAVAPKVYYLNNKDRVSITGFINAKPFPLQQANIKLPALLSKLHAQPPFPFRLNYLDMIGTFIKQFKASGMLAPILTDDLFGAYEKIVKIYPLDPEDMVACHNDLKPENIIYDGERPWIVDWEAAFLNDRYFDLSIVANFTIKNDKDEHHFLNAYFRRKATVYEHARFYLMRQMLHTSYFATFMIYGKNSDEPVNSDIPRPGFHEFHDLVWNGKVSMAEMDNRIKYALVHMDQLKENLRSERFINAMDTVANYQ